MNEPASSPPPDPSAPPPSLGSADSRAFFYVHIDDNHRTSQVFLHIVGTDPAQDRLIIEEPDGAWFVSLSESRCKRFGIVSIHGHDASECWLIDLNAPQSPPRLARRIAANHMSRSLQDADRALRSMLSRLAIRRPL